MLIGNASKRPSLVAVRRIKSALIQALELPESAVVTVTQLSCLEDECAPLETVIGLLRLGEPQVQHKIHKATDSINHHDLALTCEAWGVPVPITAFESIFKEI